MRKRRGREILQSLGLCAVILLGSAAWGISQDMPGAPPAPDHSNSDPTRTLEAKVMELESAMTQMQSQMTQIQVEARRLRSELQNTRAQIAAMRSDTHPASPLAAAPADNHSAGPSTAAAAGPEDKVQDRISNLEEKQQLLESKIDDQYQTKVESASKYRVILSGIALLNVFSNRGSVDNLDIPHVAQGPGPLSSNATFGATVRQSEIGIEVFGPSLAGARTHGEVQTDFFGGFPNTLNGVSSGIMRIRTATVHMDWHNTSVVAGQDTLFFAPLYPTSFASLVEPAFSYSGDLWGWVPQIRLEHHIHFSNKSELLLQGGILDPLTGEPSSAFYRTAQAGERSGQPSYASRVAWSSSAFGSPVTIGVGGYYSPENWGFGRKIDGWAGMADFNLPLGRWFAFSGELYRGQAIGGLGGGIGRSVLYNGPLSDPVTSVLGLNSAGGWSQLKFHPTERLEFNGAFGEDDTFAAALRRFPAARSYLNPAIGRNQSGLVNVIYHPRSDLVLSLEYRRLWTSDVDEAPYRAGQINLGIGVLF